MPKGWCSTVRGGKDKKDAQELNENTYDPEQPSLHFEDRNHVTGVHNHDRNEESCKTESNIEVGAHETEGPEETLHSQERHIDLYKKMP